MSTVGFGLASRQSFLNCDMSGTKSSALRYSTLACCTANTAQTLTALEFELTGLLGWGLGKASKGMKIGLTTNRNEAAGMREGNDSTG